jgi:hypothetical protein
MQKNPSDDEIRQFENLLSYIDKNPEQDLTAVFPALDIQSEKIKSLTDSNYQYLHYISMNKRLGVLSEVADLGLKIMVRKAGFKFPSMTLMLCKLHA